jgi:hypothetical protein
MDAMRNTIRKHPPGEGLAVEVPTAEKDKPAWVKVGVIAAVGFVVGIAWPRLAGVRIGPTAPSEAAAAASAAHAGRAPDAPPASVTKPAASVSAAPPATTPPSPAGVALPPTITVARGLVLNCTTTDGDKKKGKDCGAVPGVDEIVRPRIKKLANCSGMEGQTGKFTLTANADFVSGRFWYDINKANATVQNFDAVQSCLKTMFHNTATTATPHEHAKYTVVYTAQLAPGTSDDDKAVAHKEKDKDKAADKPDESKAKTEDKPAEKPAAANATGEADVVWDVALVRDNPKTGALVSRLPKGSKVKVGATKDGWYQIKYGDGFGSEGWVYRGAIGR